MFIFKESYSAIMNKCKIVIYIYVCVYMYVCTRAHTHARTHARTHYLLIIKLCQPILVTVSFNILFISIICVNFYERYISSMRSYIPPLLNVRQKYKSFKNKSFKSFKIFFKALFKYKKINYLNKF